MKESLRELLEQFKFLESDDIPDDFDPAQLVGDVREKVDAIRYAILNLQARADFEEQSFVAPFVKHINALRRKATRLEEYVRTQMLEHGFEKIPGNIFRAQLQDNNPSVVCDFEADETQYAAYPEFVRKEVTYSWAKTTLKEKLDAGAELPFARLTRKRGVRFYPVNKNNEAP